MSMRPPRPLARTLGGAPHGVRIEHAVADRAHLSAALGHEHLAVGKERLAPRPLQAARVDDDADVLAFGRVIDDGLVRQRRYPDAVRRDRDAVSEFHAVAARRRKARRVVARAEGLSRDRTHASPPKETSARSCMRVRANRHAARACATSACASPEPRDDLARHRVELEDVVGIAEAVRLALNDDVQHAVRGSCDEPVADRCPSRRIARGRSRRSRAARAARSRAV